MQSDIEFDRLTPGGNYVEDRYLTSLDALEANMKDKIDANSKRHKQ